jgi:hypothetical protein
VKEDSLIPIPRRRPRIFNTAFESGMRSLILLTSCFPRHLGLRKLVVLDHMVVHTADIDGPPSLHPQEESRAAELLVRRRLVESGLALMGTRSLITRHATPEGFRYQAGEEAGTFIDLLQSNYTLDLRTRADWLAQNIVPLSDDALNQLVNRRIDQWAPEFQADSGPGA